MASHIFRCDPEVYSGLSLAQLTSRQGRVKNMLQDALVLPYQLHGVTYMIRTRLLDPSDDRKYFSPAGDMFCGGKPIFFLHDVLNEPNSVILTEGEIKALLATQHGEREISVYPLLHSPESAFSKLR